MSDDIQYRCPQCKSLEVASQCMAKGDGPDTNKARCDECGWKGTTEQAATSKAYEERCKAASEKLGTAIDEADIYCPMCVEQPLSRDGDDATFLFCPHCELEMKVNVRLSWRHRR